MCLWFFSRLVSACLNRGVQLNSAWRRVNHPRWAAFTSRQDDHPLFAKEGGEKSRACHGDELTFLRRVFIDLFGSWRGLSGVRRLPPDRTFAYPHDPQSCDVCRRPYRRDRRSLTQFHSCLLLRLWHKLRQERSVTLSSGSPPRHYGIDTPCGLATIADRVDVRVDVCEETQR